MIKKPLNTRQNGSTLIIALVMLLLISLLAVGGMQGSILQERMASNSHDRSIAFQASEAALRQAEEDIMGNLDTRRTATSTALLPRGGLDWNGSNPAVSGTGDVGTGVNSEPVYHLAQLALICGSELGGNVICYERFQATSRGEGGSAQAVAIIQSTVLLPPE